jgi:4'-phosphopantetheinyl transferase
MVETLGASAHVWFCRVSASLSPAHVARWAELLDTVELARWQRYRRAEDRHLFLVAHAFLRTTLSRYAEVSPAHWQFCQGEHGRPKLVAPELGFDLRFNLSHTQGLVAVVVNQDIDCGIDVEPMDRDVDIDIVARRNFAIREQADVLARSGEARQRRFLELWTLKESYLKARGLGLSLPLAKFAMTVAKPVTIAFEAPINDDPAAWQFHLSRPTAAHQLAVALRRDKSSDRSIVVREACLPGENP